MISTSNPVVIAFLALITVWLFARRGEARDRFFLALAAVVYVAGMAATFWKFGGEENGRLMGSVLLETLGLLLVTLSRRIKRNSKKSNNPEVSDL